MNRNGKIGRLPKTIREELNQRLEQGGQGSELLSWLNSQPEVQGMMATFFGGRPVSKQSLSQWRRFSPERGSVTRTAWQAEPMSEPPSTSQCHRRAAAHRAALRTPALPERGSVTRRAWQAEPMSESTSTSQCHRRAAAHRAALRSNGRRLEAWIFSEIWGLEFGVLLPHPFLFALGMASYVVALPT